MTRQEFTLEFPLKRTTIKVEANPLSIRSIAIAYLKKQAIALGDICLIRDDNQVDGEYNGTIIAIACYKNVDDTEASFFVEERDYASDIKDLEESEVHDE